MLFCKRQINGDKFQKTFVSSEHTKRHIAHNLNHNSIYQYRVDGDLITHEKQLRCDFLLENEDTKRVYFIELKGSDLIHAVEQVENTIRLFSQIIEGYAVLPRIVCRSNTHNLQLSKVLKFRQAYPSSLIQNNVIEENI